MQPDSPATPPVNPQGYDALSETWLDLAWSPWVPFDAAKEFWYIPRAPGLYRIKPVDRDFLMFIGETGRPLSDRLNELRQNLRRADMMPWGDPQPEAPALWAWWVEWAAEASRELPPDRGPENEGPADAEDGPGPVMLECSAAPLDVSAPGRKGMESFLLYRYRQELGESPLCNFGRFHPRYRRSTTKSEGRRGGKLRDGQQDNPAGFPCTDPLEPAGRPGDRDWMGLEWESWQPFSPDRPGTVAEGAGLFLLADAATHEIVYIGQAAAISKRLIELGRRSWEGRALEFSYQVVGQAVLPHNLRELETDLVGNFYEQYRKAPEFQFRNRQ